MKWQYLRPAILNYGKVDPILASDYLHSKFEWTTERAKEICGKNFVEDFPTVQHSTGWQFGQPLGVCDHFTADSSLVGVLRWFSSHKWNGKLAGASSAVVIDTDGTSYVLTDWWNNKTDWHEPKLNKICLGIEHINAGELRKNSEGLWCSWADNWNKPYPYTEKLPPVQTSSGWFAPFTREQLMENLVIKKCFIALHDARPEYFVDHRMYRTDKKDCGDHFPLSLLRLAAFSEKPIQKMSFLGKFPSWDGSKDISTECVEIENLADNLVGEDLSKTTNNSEILWTQISLNALYGSNIRPAPETGILDAHSVEIIKVFQSETGLLKVDGVPGPETRRMLREALLRKLGLT